MFEKKITSTFVNANDCNAHHDKHREEAAKTLGENPLAVSSESGAEEVADDDGNVIGTVHRLTTVWRQRG